MALPIAFSKSLTAANATAIAQSQSPGAAALTINGSLASGGVATLSTQRRVQLASGGDDSAVTFTVVGTNGHGNRITDTFLGTNASTTQSNMDFLTVSSITPSAAIAGTITAGTNGVGSSSWRTMDAFAMPMSIGFAVVTGTTAVNYTVQHTFDDPNNLPSGVVVPQALPHPIVASATTTLDGAYAMPISAIRLTINSGTGAARMTILPAGLGV